jgi:hypothetical protein
MTQAPLAPPRVHVETYRSRFMLEPGPALVPSNGSRFGNWDRWPKWTGTIGPFSTSASYSVVDVSCVSMTCMDRCSCRRRLQRGHCCEHRGRTRADGNDRQQLAIDRQSDTDRALQVCSKQRVRRVRARAETTYETGRPLVRLRRRTGNIPIWPGIVVAVPSPSPSPSPAGRRCR